MQYLIKVPKQIFIRWGLSLQDTPTTLATAVENMANVAEEMLEFLKPGYVPLVLKRFYVVHATNHDGTECRTLEDALEIIASHYKLNPQNGVPPKLNSLRTMMANAVDAGDGGNKNKRWSKNMWDENGAVVVLSVTMRKKLSPT